MSHTFLRQSYTTPQQMTFAGPAGRLSGVRRIGGVYDQAEGKAVGDVYTEGRAVGNVYKQSEGTAVGNVYKQSEGTAVGHVYPQGEGRAIQSAHIGAHLTPGARRWGTPPATYPMSRRVAKGRFVPRTLRGARMGQDEPNAELISEAAALFAELPVQPAERKEAFRAQLQQCLGIPSNPSVMGLPPGEIMTLQADCLKELIAELKDAMGKRGKPETVILVGVGAAIALAILMS